MRFHKLLNKGKGKNYDGYFAIDVRTSRDQWRIIIEPLNEEKKPFVPCNIDEIAKYVSDAVEDGREIYEERKAEEMKAAEEAGY